MLVGLVDDLPSLSLGASTDSNTLLFETRRKHTDEDAEVEIAQKHQVLQDVIVNHVYMGGTPSLVEEAGFGKGAQGYAKLQCAMSDHEGDPLIAEYATSAMMKIWSAAGLDLSSVTGPGLDEPK